MMDHPFLSQENLRSVTGLELLARKAVEGFLPGLNISRRAGVGQEFSQYRTYQPGDDLRLLDWKMYARSDRFFVREAEIESHITLRFVVDLSASMLHEEKGLNKLDYARFLIATLAYLGLRQGDRLGLYGINDRQIERLFPRLESRSEPETPCQ